MAKRKFRGKLKETIRNAYGSELKKGQEVVVWKKREIDIDKNDRPYWTGKYEYHYHNLENTILIRLSEFLIDEE